MIKHRDERGFTLIEMLVVFALLSLLMAAFMSIYIFTARAYERQNDRANAQYDARMVRQKIHEDIKESVDCWEDLTNSQNDHFPIEVWAPGLADGSHLGTNVEGERLYLEKYDDLLKAEVKVIYYIDANQILHRKRRYMDPKNGNVIDNPSITASNTRVRFTDLGQGLVKIEINGLNKDNQVIYTLSTQCKRYAE